MHQLFEQQVERTPEAVAVIHENRSLSYAELNRRANQLAHYLRTQGVAQNDRVGISLERSPEMIVAMLAILKAGGAYVPLDPDYPEERLRFMVEDAEVRLVLTQEKLRSRLPAATKLIAVDSTAEIAAQPQQNPPAIASSSDLAYVIYTSGSTGRPKGVAIEHGNTVAFCAAMGQIFSAADVNGVLASTSINFDLSVFEIFFH